MLKTKVQLHTQLSKILLLGSRQFPVFAMHTWNNPATSLPNEAQSLDATAVVASPKAIHPHKLPNTLIIKSLENLDGIILQYETRV